MIHTDHNKPSLLVLYYGEYRTFEECLCTHNFLNTPLFDVEIAFSTWNKTKTHNHRVMRPAVIRQLPLSPVSEQRIRDAFEANFFDLPLRVAIHDYDIPKKYNLFPLMISWKLAIDFAKSLPKQYDYIFLTRPDLQFNVEANLKYLSDDEMLTHLFNTRTDTPEYENTLQDYYFFGKSKEVYNQIEHYYIEYDRSTANERLGAEWHCWIKNEFKYKQVHFDKIVSSNSIEIRRPK